ncbi:MAG: SpoIIE family protein phosphatase [Chromatiales bacterium]|nr:SpoIIE family protein phosphatase [Chromatiales bacterium]
MNTVFSPLATSHEVYEKGLALVVDDELSNRIILKSLLKKSGYDVIQAENGADAVQICREVQPDIVFMDVMMPVMDGYEAVEQIRKIDLPYFLPIIFLTAITDEDALSKCIESGGDDFLTKPFSHAILKAKMVSMERIKALHSKTSSLTGQLLKDQETAESVFSRAVLAKNVAENKYRKLLQPAELFSGDVLLTAYAPSQDLNVLLGDFTGHGLAAAIGALPTSEVFRAMTQKGFNTNQILSGINRKLFNLLPTGMFFAVQFISISSNLDYITVANCGMPDILLLDGQTGAIKQRISSNNLPLGITEDINFETIVTRVNINPGDGILLVSDGVSEARNSDSEYFGQKRIEQAIIERGNHPTAFDSIVEALKSFCRDAPQDDDISLAEIPCTKEILPNWNTISAPSKQFTPALSVNDPIEFNLKLIGKRLRDSDPVPMIINQIQDMEGLNRHRRRLFTILTELYVNALDHGVLQLSSELKNSPEGFTKYFQVREQRLSSLTDEFVSINICSQSSKGQGVIKITLLDSGAGFDLNDYRKRAHSESSPLFSGRGIQLVEELCESVIYHSPGNCVEATYHWAEDDNVDH